MSNNKESENELLFKLSPEAKERYLKQEKSREKVKAVVAGTIEECQRQSFTISELESLTEQLRRYAEKMIQSARIYSKI